MLLALNMMAISGYSTQPVRVCRVRVRVLMSRVRPHAWRVLHITAADKLYCASSGDKGAHQVDVGARI